MNSIPAIGTAGENDDFHDSSLISFNYSPADEFLAVVLSTPNEDDVQELWRILLRGVLAIEFETLGDGKPLDPTILPEIYSVFEETTGSVVARWQTRLEELGVDVNFHVITFASSYLRGWGENRGLEGVRVVCRSLTIEPAPPEYRGQEYSRPRIEGE